MARRLNILQVCPSLSVGGAERLILGLAEHVRRDRFDVHVCSLGVLRGNLFQPAFERAGVPIHLIGAKRFYDLRAVPAVVRIIRSQRIDLVHTHLTGGDVIGRIAARLTGRPVVSTLHNEPRDYDQQRKDQRWLQRTTARHLATKLIAVSPSLRDQYIRAWGIPANRIVSIMNAVPMEQFLAVPEGVAQGHSQEPLITTIGRLNPQKDQKTLLDAAKLVLAQRPDARFMIVGQGRLEQELKAHAQVLGITDRVLFAGVRHDIAQVLAETSIFVLSSLWEGLPVTAAEALAAARPVVLTDVGGNRDLVEHGVNGMIVPPGDTSALADTLLALLADDERRAALGRAARERAERDLNMYAFARRHEELYTSLLEQTVPTTTRQTSAPPDSLS